jgi:hypothetical protein
MTDNDLGWWIIHGENLLTALHMVAQGDDPDLVYAELYANAEIDDQRIDNAEEN